MTEATNTNTNTNTNTTSEGIFDNFTDKAFKPSGRMSRVQYLVYRVITIASVFVFSFIFAYLTTSGQVSTTDGIALLSILLIGSMFAVAYMSIVIMIKRLHDMGMVGTHVIWVLLVPMVLGVVPPIGFLVGLGIELWLLFSPGQNQENVYGPTP